MNGDVQIGTGATLWFTGLSAAGKSTLARAVQEDLRARGYRTELLDGDDLRLHLNRDLGFSKADRDENVRRIAYVASLLTRHGVIVLVSAISPYRQAREYARETIGRFVEIFVDAPLSVCEQRDPKGLYRRVRRGELQHFTGIDDPYEEPPKPEIRCRTDRESVEMLVERIVAFVATYDAEAVPPV